MTTSTIGAGKTGAFVDHVQRRLGDHRGARRLWLEGKRLTDIGFKAGVRYQVLPGTDSLTLKLSAQGDRKVSHKQGRPVVDLLTHDLPQVDYVEVRFAPRSILVTLHSNDAAAQARLRRLNARLAAGEQLLLGSVCHGGGIASDALVSGLGDTQLAFAVEQSAAYIEQSKTRGPLSKGGISFEGDLGDLDPTLLPQVDVIEAGLPCVAASRAGRSKKHLDRPEQDLQVADLAAAFCEVIRATQPAVIVLENVPEYADSASADLIRRRLGRWGYQLHEQVIHGAEWSLEARDRWILVAATRGLDLDLSSLVPTSRPAALGDVLDRRVEASRWHTFAHLDRKAERDQAKGSKFTQRVLTPQATSVPTLRRGYQKGGSTDPRLAHPTRKGYSRLLTPAEHARVKGIPAALVQGLSDTVAHEILGQSVIAPAFAALGAAIRGAL